MYRAFRGLWRLTPLIKRTAPFIVVGVVGFKLQSVVWPESNKARALVANNSASHPPALVPQLQEGRYGPTKFENLSDAEMRDITHTAIQLYKASIDGINKGIVEFAMTIWPAWSDFIQAAQKTANDEELKAKEKEFAKLFNSKLPEEGQRAQAQILAILGLQNIDQFFAEATQKITDTRNKSIADVLPNALRALTRFRELNQWSDVLYEEIETKIDTKTYNTDIGNLPARHRQLFVERFRWEHPKVADDVVQLLADVAEIRIKVGLLQPYLENKPTGNLQIEVKRKFEWFTAAFRWVREYQNEKENFDQFIVGKTKKAFPGLSESEVLEVLSMAKEIKSDFFAI